MEIPRFRNAYEINISAKADTLEFITDHNITYEIYTGPGRKIIPGFVFTSDIIYFGFHPLGKKASGDEKVMLTIINFMLDILEEKNAIAAYIYSAERNRHAAREKYFNRLFDTHSKNSLHRITFDLGEDGKAVIVFRPDNANVNAILSLAAEEIIARMEEKEKYEEYYS